MSDRPFGVPYKETSQGRVYMRQYKAGTQNIWKFPTDEEQWQEERKLGERQRRQDR